MRWGPFLLSLLILLSCKQEKEVSDRVKDAYNPVSYANGFTIETRENGLILIKVNSAWPNASRDFVYALVPKENRKIAQELTMEVDAVVHVPVDRIIVTSTTHVPALEALGVENRLIGFPETRYVSSQATRNRIEAGEISDLGSNELLNTEIAIALEPDLVVGFGIDNQNNAYKALERVGIPVVYNGDWTEETPLGKAEWIKFFGPFFGKENEADSIFRHVEQNYNQAKKLAQTATEQPSVLSGALYKDVWYLPGGSSWAAKFIEDANAEYLWKDHQATGSLSLSLEAVLAKGQEADVWISPSQFESYTEMEEANNHYLSFKPFREKKVFTFARTKGKGGGLLYYEQAPGRPDVVLKDLIHVFHPDLLPDYQPYFFKPLE